MPLHNQVWYQVWSYPTLFYGAQIFLSSYKHCTYFIELKTYYFSRLFLFVVGLQCENMKSQKLSWNSYKFWEIFEKIWYYNYYQNFNFFQGAMRIYSFLNYIFVKTFVETYIFRKIFQKLKFSQICQNLIHHNFFTKWTHCFICW